MPGFGDDIYLGDFGPAGAYAPNMEGATSTAGPSPMANGVGPMGRVYIWDTVPLVLQAAALCALQQIVGAGNFTLTAGTGVTAVTDATGTVRYTLDVPRNVTIASAGNISARTFTVYGYDIYGQSMSEAITGPNANTVAGLKAFKSITRVAVSGAVATDTSVGYGDVLGSPVKIGNKGYIVSVKWNNVLAADAGTSVVADANTATTTTGDVRGTYVPSSATDGSKRLVMCIALPAAACGPNATRAGAFGVTQA